LQEKPNGIGIIGLGRMGTNMLRRLLRAVHQCDVYDIHPEAVQVLVKARARLAVEARVDPRVVSSTWAVEAL
jgi:6-phosphogluconate dehydrogenase (decarboxylating)